MAFFQLVALLLPSKRALSKQKSFLFVAQKPSVLQLQLFLFTKNFMIVYIKGRLTYRSPSSVMETSNGIGYKINISAYTYAQLPTSDEACHLLTYYHVKEDSQTLFGFTEDGERTLFIQLLSVSNVGPSSAQMILSSMNPNEIQQAILAEDVNALKSVKGIGPKTAKRIILELKDKIIKGEHRSASTMASATNHRSEALEALVALGFPKPSAQKALNKILNDASQMPIKSVEMLIKAALKVL